MLNTERHIVQIIPATDCYALYKEDGRDKPYACKVQCFALVEEMPDFKTNYPVRNIFPLEAVETVGAAGLDYLDDNILGLVDGEYLKKHNIDVVYCVLSKPPRYGVALDV